MIASALTALLAAAALAHPGSTGAPLAAGQTLTGIACPSVSQCVVVDKGNGETSFNPQKPGQPVRHAVGTQSGEGFNAVTCVSATQCTGVDAGGEAVTFDPADPAGATQVLADPSGFETAVACPSATECVAIGGNGDETTFDPTSPAVPTPVQVDADDPSLTALACPSATQCTLVGADGEEVTFNPQSPATATSADVAGGAPLRGLACPSANQCTAVTPAGSGVGFDPTNAQVPAAPGSGPGRNAALACPTVTQCVVAVISSSGVPDVFGLDPQTNAASAVTSFPASTSSSQGLIAIACPSAAQCTVAYGSEEVTFNPSAPGSFTAATPPRAKIVTSTATVAATGRTTIRISCSGGGTCHGRLTLSVPGVALAGASYSVSSGATRSVAVKLTAAGLSRLKRAAGRRLSATVGLTVSGGASVSARVILKR